MIIDIGTSIIALMGEPIIITRYNAVGYNVDGFVFPTGQSTINAVANVQPTSPAQLALLAEGERKSEAVTITTLFPMITSDTVDAVYSDKIEWHGKLYKATKAEDRLSRTNHFHTVCTRLEP